MTLLLDTHYLLWSKIWPHRLSARARDLLTNPETDLYFSSANIWEVAVKRALDRADFDVDPNALRQILVDSGYKELSIESDHTIAAASLPLLHKDPFDRILIGQAQVEGLTLLSLDRKVLQYKGDIRSA